MGFIYTEHNKLDIFVARLRRHEEGIKQDLAWANTHCNDLLVISKSSVPPSCTYLQHMLSNTVHPKGGAWARFGWQKVDITRKMGSIG